MNPYDIAPLLEPRASLVIPLLEYIPRLQDHLGAYFLPPEPGIYVMNDIVPLLQTGRYYAESQYPLQIPLTELDTVREAVVDDSGMVVIPRYVMQHKHRFLSPVPKVPVRAIQTAVLLIKIRISRRVRHDWNLTPETMIGNYLQPVYRSRVRYDELEELCFELIKLVDDFIDHHVWSIFFVNRHQHDVIIDRAEDFRIVDWTRQQSEHWQRETYRLQSLRELGLLDLSDTNSIYLDDWAP